MVKHLGKSVGFGMGIVGKSVGFEAGVVGKKCGVKGWSCCTKLRV